MSETAAISATCGGFEAEGDGFSPFLKPEVFTPALAGRPSFLLLILACAALIVRPSDLYPQPDYWPVYQTIILLSLAFCIRPVVGQILGNVGARSITLLLVAFGASIVLSHLVRGNLYAIRTGGFEFFKVIVFYLVVLATIDSVSRLRIFLLALVGFTLVLTMIAVASYDGLLDVPALEAIRQSDSNSEGGVVRRLVGTGIFNDPNDLSLLLVVAIGCCFCFATTSTSSLLRLGWWIPIGFLLYAVMLTYSRGGLIALVGGAAVAMALRLGLGRTVMWGAALLPVLFIAVGGRQTSVDLSSAEDTFQTRLDHWSEALTLFKGSPFIGVGQDQQVELFGQVAHNTYIQSFAELGLIGGACFLGMIGLSFLGVKRIDLGRADPVLVSFRPYIAGVIAGYAIGLLSLSRGYTISTYLVIALAAAFVNLSPRARPLVLSGRFFQKLAVASLATIVGTYVFIRVMSGAG